LALPLFGDLLEKPAKAPTLANARKRLGGKANRSTQTGAVVRLIDEAKGAGSVGIVLHADEGELDVLLGAQLLRKTKLELTLPADPHAVDAVLLADVRVFAALEEGDRVRFSDASGAAEGVLVEKCRYGALVAKDDGTILAVGFRKLWPVSTALA
jgi:hypothetical protein